MEGSDELTPQQISRYATVQHLENRRRDKWGPEDVSKEFENAIENNTYLYVSLLGHCLGPFNDEKVKRIQIEGKEVLLTEVRYCNQGSAQESQTAATNWAQTRGKHLFRRFRHLFGGRGRVYQYNQT